jgi:hypothetical protein
MTEGGEGEKITRLEFFKKVKEGAKLAGALGLIGVLMELARRSTEKTEKDFPPFGYYEGKIIIPKGTNLRRLPIRPERTEEGEPSNVVEKLTEDLEIENPEVVRGARVPEETPEGQEGDEDKWLKFTTEIKGEKITVFAFKPVTRPDPEVKFIEYGNE